MGRAKTWNLGDERPRSQIDTMPEKTKNNVIPFELFMTGISIYAIVVASLRLFLHTGSEIQLLFLYFDGIACVIFVLAFVRHAIFERKRFKYIFTWGIIDLLSAIPWWPALRYIRAIRVLRVIWMVRARGQLSYAIQRDPSASLLYLLTLALLWIYSLTCVGVLQFENQDPDATIKTAADALWFGLVTVSTVGYGELVPVTTGARICAAILMFSGIGVFASLAGFLLEPLRRLASGSKAITTADVAARVNDLYDLLESKAAAQAEKEAADAQQSQDDTDDDASASVKDQD